MKRGEKEGNYSLSLNYSFFSLHIDTFTTTQLQVIMK